MSKITRLEKDLEQSLKHASRLVGENTCLYKKLNDLLTASNKALTAFDPLIGLDDDYAIEASDELNAAILRCEGK